MNFSGMSGKLSDWLLPPIVTSLKQRLLIGFCSFETTSFVDTKNTVKDFTMSSCVLCGLCMVKRADRNLADGLRGNTFKVQEEYGV